MKIRPLNDRILVQRLEEEEKTAGGIIIPDNAKEKPVEGTIIAVGPGKLNDAGERVAPQVKEGDTVLFSKYGGTNRQGAGYIEYYNSGIGYIEIFNRQINIII